MTVLKLLELLFDVCSSVLSYNCDGSRMSLPCGRDIWRASTSTEWSNAYVAGKSVAKDGERQLTYKDLLNIGSRRDDTLDSWLSQLDDFGTLVMAAASMPV